MTATSDKIATALRAVAPGGKLMPEDVPLLDKLAANWDGRIGGTPLLAALDPAWIVAARTMIGQKEIPGSKNNPWIVSFWQRLGAKWFNDDETPWCGGFAAWSLDQAGLPYPKEFPRAASFKDWGVPCTPQLGAIGVKARTGGNHVFFIVGETSDRRYFKALGGNQSNAVTIMDILKTDVDAIRWPAGSQQPVVASAYLPILPKGTISTNEA